MSLEEAALLHLVHSAEPSAAAPLYERFAPGVRAILSRKLAHSDVETGVFHVLLTVACAVRQGQIQDPATLPAQVLAAANAYIAELAHKTPVDGLREELDRLEPQEREILARFYRLGQSEEQIRREMKIPAERISAVRKKARQGFLARQAQSAGSH